MRGPISTTYVNYATTFQFRLSSRIEMSPVGLGLLLAHLQVHGKYTVSGKKRTNSILSITLSNTGRF